MKNRNVLSLVVPLVFLLLTGGVASAAPFVGGFSPSGGYPGTRVTITGSGFSNATRVTIGIEPMLCDFEVANATTIYAVIPPGAISGRFTVSGPSGTHTGTGTFRVAPRVSLVNPGRGTAGDSIAVSGANFITGATQVRFGGVPAGSVSVTGDFELFATVPAGGTSGPVRVDTAFGYAIAEDDFIISAAPEITGFNPTSAMSSSQSIISISGVNFTGTTNVKFNGVAADFDVVGDGQINVPSVPATATTGPISVTTPFGSDTTSSNFVVGPSFVSFSPTAQAPGQVVSIILLSYPSDNIADYQVFFNGVKSPQVTRPGQINAVVPTNATTGKILVKIGALEAISDEDLIIGPEVFQVLPQYGPVGTRVTVLGEGFVSTPAGGVKVKFNGVEGTSLTSPALGQFDVTVPPNATTGPLSVETAFGTNVASEPFIVTTNLPVIMDAQPRSGPQGTVVTLTGALFAGVTEVRFNGVPGTNLEIPGDTEMRVTVPPNAISGPLSIKNQHGTNTTDFNFFAAPRLTGFSPTNGIAGDLVTITGSNFTGAASVLFNKQPGELVEVSSNSVIARVTAAARTGPIEVVTTAGPIISSSNFLVQPHVTGFDPVIGPVGTPVEISGTTFVNVTNVLFNTTPATYTVESPGLIKTTVPADATTGPITVQTVDGTSTTSTNFTVTFASDLGLTLTATPPGVEPNGTFTLTTVLSNLGASPVTGVTLTNRLFSPSLSVMPGSIQISRGECTVTDDDLVSCDIGVLTNQTSVTLSLDVQAGAGGIFQINAGKGAVEGDPVAANDVASIQVAVVSDENRSLSIEPVSASDSVVLSWPVSNIPFRLQLGATNNFPLTFTNSTKTPVVINGRNRVTNEIDQPLKFYRLIWP